jgi:hypothetical protein
LWWRKWKAGSKEEKKEFRRRKEGRKKKRRIVKGEDEKMWEKMKGRCWKRRRREG